jgi:hypothetical protein
MMTPWPEAQKAKRHGHYRLFTMSNILKLTG